MKLEDIAIIDAVFQEPNLSAVAERFHQTQSSVSKILKRIENELGFPLFERKGFQGLRPTAQGLLFAERAGRLNRAWRETLELVRSYDRRKIDIKVTGPALYMRNIFLRRWFTSALPVRFRLTYVESRIDRISLAAAAGDLDLAITPSPFELPDWVATPIFTEEFAIFTAAALDTPPTRADLRAAGWVAYHAVNDQIRSFFHENQISSEQVVAYIEDIEGILEVLTDDKRLFSLLPSHAALSQNRRLRRFPWKQGSGQTFYLMHRKGNPPAKELAGELKKLLA